MKQKEYIDLYINKLIEKIHISEQQWNGTRFASIDDSSIQASEQEDYEIQYQEILQKYRGKNGNIKPLGLILFNKYMFSLFVLFFGLTLLLVPVAIVESFGKGLQEFKSISSFSKIAILFSVANLPHYRLDDLTELQLSEITLNKYLILSTDIIAIFAIFVFVLYLKITIARVTNDYMAKSPAPNLYCLEIQNIQKCNQQQILQHFSKFGKIAQISLVYTHKDLINDLRKIVKLITHLSHLKPDQKLFQQIVTEIRKKYKQLSYNYLTKPKPTMKLAFICFQQISTRNRVYNLYKYEINPKNLDLCVAHHYIDLNLNNEHQMTNMGQETLSNQINKQNFIRPIVKKCNYQPLTINWQNCDIEKSSQSIKFICQFLLLVLVAFIILIGLFLLNINSSHIRQNTTPTSSSLQFQKSFDKKQIREKYTFCASLTIADFKWQYYDLCDDYIQLQRNRFVLMLTFALMVAVINLLTNRILWALVAFRRYRTLAERNSFLVTSIFLFSLINGAILILFMRGQNTGPILRKMVSTILNFSEDALQVAIYFEFNRNWYVNIGAQLVMNFIVSLIVFPHFHILLHWVRTKYRQFKTKRNQKPTKKPIFNYCTFYALSLKSIFFALVYSNSMPIFYPLCCITLIVQIYVNKLLLKIFVDQPVYVDNNTIKVVANLIPYSLLVHCLTSILFLNVEEIFPLENSYQNINGSWVQTNLLKVQRGFVYIFIFIFIVTYIWNQKRIDDRIIHYWLGRTQTKTQCDQTKKFKDIKNNPAFLASYKMKDNPKYKIIFSALQLFCSHMQNIRQKKQIQQIGQNQDLDISTIFAEEDTITNNNLNKNTSSLKSVNINQQQKQNGNQIQSFKTTKSQEQYENWSQVVSQTIFQSEQKLEKIKSMEDIQEDSGQKI